MEGDEEAIIQIEQLLSSKEYERRAEEFTDFINFVYCICHEKTDDDEEEECDARYSSRDDILTGLKDILRAIPRYNMTKSMEHLQIIDFTGVTYVLVLLFRSLVKENKEISEKCIRLFLIDPKTNSGFFLPRSIQNQCATIVLGFCTAFCKTADDEERQLYHSCHETLISILKSIAFSNRPTYFGIAKTSELIGGLYNIFHEIDMKLHKSLVSTYLSPSPLATTELRSLKRNFREFALFSLHIRNAIHEHVRVKGPSLPLNPDIFEKYSYYLNDIYIFYLDFTSLVRKVNECLYSLDAAIRDAGSSLKFNIGWSYLLSILKELSNISKLYEDGEELLSSAFRAVPLAMSYLIGHSKRGDDHLWLLKYDAAIDFESRIHLMVMMFPEVKDDDRKLHKMLIDRSLLLKESFEHIALVEARSLHNGLFVEFKNEVATGHGVLREWLLLVCHALFSPEYSLFVECPED